MVRARPIARVAGLSLSVALASCVLALSACREDAGGVTGVFLRVRYTEPAPARLRVSGRTRDARAFGPSLLPDPPRALARAQESVLIELSSSMHGARLTLEIAGLDDAGIERARGSSEVTVARGRVVSATVTLAPACVEAGPTVDAGSCPGGVHVLDAGVLDASALDAGLGSGCDAASCHEDAAAPAAPAAPDAPDAAVDAAALPDACAAACSEPPPPPTEPFCGDAHCNGAETSCTCEADCGSSICGDEVCCPDRSEDACSCGPDCGASSCGDGLCCAAAGEQSCNCPADCGAGSCGDGFCCATSEDACTCPDDCELPSCTGCESGCCADACPAGGCELACSACTCAFDCRRAESCGVTCSDGADCAISCRRASDCESVRCVGGASCLIQCDGTRHCSFAECEGAERACPGNRVVCNRACPGGG